MTKHTHTQQKASQLIVIGAGGQASNIVNIALSLNYSIKAFIHNGKSGQSLFGSPIISDLKEIEDLDTHHICLALGDNYQREKYLNDALSRFPNLYFPTLIHPTANVGPYSKIGAGTVIMPYTVIGTNVQLGGFCLLGNQSCVGHDSVLSDFSSLSPAATLAGNVSLGHRSAIGLGAKVREKVKVGDNTILGANSFLNEDLPNNVIAIGTPAKIKRNRNHNDII
jgi:sugar O-acyltransferase (sialic acid O-acetyltransferase NeuD family)